MRMDQPMGLPKEAEAFLGDNAVMEDKRPCPHCGKGTEQWRKSVEVGSYPGMFDTEYPLLKYDLRDGWAVEFLQCSPWFSGPMMFLGLSVYDKNNVMTGVFKWEEEEIQKYFLVEGGDDVEEHTKRDE